MIGMVAPGGGVYKRQVFRPGLVRTKLEFSYRGAEIGEQVDRQQA